MSEREPSSPSWMLVQLADLLLRAELANDRALTHLHDVDGELAETSSLTVSSDRLADLDAKVHEVAQLAARAEQLVEALPRADVTVTYAEAANGAARELADGTMLDADRVLLATGLLDAETGLRALATCLEHSDVHTAWEDVTIVDVLGSLRGMTSDSAQRIATAAHLSPAAEIAACEPDEIVALVARIEAHLSDRA